MSDSSRWLVFIVLASVVLFFTMSSQRKQMEERNKAIKEREAAKLAEKRRDAEAAKNSDGASAAAEAQRGEEEELAAWKNSRREVVRTSSLLMEFGAYGGRLESLKVIDPDFAVNLRGADVDKLSTKELAQAGEELVTDFPDRKGVPLRPLELKLAASNVSYKDLNRLEWEILQTKGKDGETIVEMKSPLVRGDIRATKRLTIPAQGFDIGLSIELTNESDQRLFFAQVDDNQNGLGLAIGPAAGPYQTFDSYLSFSNGVYYNGSIHTADPKLKELKLAPGGNLMWGALQDHYHLIGVIGISPGAVNAARVAIPTDYQPKSGKVEPKKPVPYRFEFFTPKFDLAPGKSTRFDYVLFAGPKSRPELKAASAKVAAATNGTVNPNLGRAVFYNSWNWFRALCLGMMWLLDKFHAVVGNWGLAIILLTVSVKLATHPINHRALRATAEFQRDMAKIKPEIDALNEKYKGAGAMADKQKAMSELYKRHGVNPLAPLRGCLPMFVQLPIFVALYRIFSDYIVLRGATFLWVKDLSSPDALFAIGGFHVNALPLLMVATQIVAMRLSAKNVTDPTQRMMSYMMPVMMLFFFYNLASGLFLYWTMQNLWQIGHTLITNKEVEHEDEAKQAEKASALLDRRGTAAGSNGSGEGAKRGGQPLRVAGESQSTKGKRRS
jgi:YidC/Oxa1 family membrane protein insertase